MLQHRTAPRYRVSAVWLLQPTTNTPPGCPPRPLLPAPRHEGLRPRSHQLLHTSRTQWVLGKHSWATRSTSMLDRPNECVGEDRNREPAAAGPWGRR